MIRLGLMSFSDGRDDVHESLVDDIRQHEVRIKQILEDTGEVEVVVAQEVIHSPEGARREARRLSDQHVDGVILNIAVFAFPNYVVIATQFGRGPYLVLGPQDPRYPGLTGLLAVGGALNQIGTVHSRLWVDLDEDTVSGKLLAFARAAHAVTQLRGQVYGLVGGRSIGMYTGAAPGELWQKTFGVDVDHVDQSEIVRQAPLVAESDVVRARHWLEGNLKEILYDGDQLTPEKLDFEIRCYIALKQIVEKYQFDFVGLKCHFDMSAYYSVQCLAATFLNDPYDWEGAKPPVPLACEADSDGALTMQILTLISGLPSCLLDLRFYDTRRQIYVMPNCGAVPTWFAGRTLDPAENMSRVRMVPAIKKYAGGGAHFEFVFKEGDLTLARLTRSPAGYRMLMTHADTREFAISDVMGAGANWPHAFVDLQVLPDTLVTSLQSNHMHAIAGDYRAELTEFCHLQGIEVVHLQD